MEVETVAPLEIPDNVADTPLVPPHFAGREIAAIPEAVGEPDPEPDSETVVVAPLEPLSQTEPLAENQATSKLRELGVKIERSRTGDGRVFSLPGKIGSGALDEGLWGDLWQLIEVAGAQIGTDPTIVFGGVEIGALSAIQNIESLDLTGGAEISDLWPLARMAKLRILNLSGLRQITDLGPLASLDKLASLNLTGADGISDLSPLADIASLRELNLVFAQSVTDLSALAGMTRLRSLALGGTLHDFDLTPLARLEDLRELDLNCSPGVHDLAPIAALKNLTTLKLRCARGIDIGAIANLAALEFLDLGNNAITDLAPLAGLAKLTRLDLADNDAIGDLGPVARLPSLVQLVIDEHLLAEAQRAIATRPTDYPEISVEFSGSPVTPGR